jgi:hypothetical protein
MSFSTYQPSILPAWLQGPNGLAYAGALGSLKDTLGNYVRAAATAGCPLATMPDALPAIGYERQLIRGPAETDAQYAERLRTAFDAWGMAGTPLGMLLQIEVLYPGIPVVIVQQAARAFTLNPDTSLPALQRLVITNLNGGGWVFDANSGLPPSQGFWSRFGVLFPGPLPPTWTDIESPPTTSTAPTTAEVNNLIAIVNKWRPAKATAVWIKVVTSGLIWGWPVTNLWGNSGLTWGGTVCTWATTPY